MVWWVLVFLGRCVRVLRRSDDARSDVVSRRRGRPYCLRDLMRARPETRMRSPGASAEECLQMLALYTDTVIGYFGGHLKAT